MEDATEIERPRPSGRIGSTGGAGVSAGVARTAGVHGQCPFMTHSYRAGEPRAVR